MVRADARRVIAARRGRTVVVLLAIAGLAVSERVAPAACAGPEIELARTKAAVGETLALRGRNWFSGCRDTGACTVNACGREECDYGPPGKPLRDISLYLVGPKGAARRAVRLATVDADRRFGFIVRAEVPAVGPGRYVVVGRSDGGDARSFDTLRVVAR